MERDILKAMMHPIRIKIIQELGLRKTATTKELLESCGDCAQATLYRHLKGLLKNNIIKVDSTHEINGIIEKVYSLSDDLTSKIIKDPDEMTKEDYLNLFMHYIVSIISNFSAFFEEENAAKRAPHNIGFSTSSLFLSDEELAEMNKELVEVFMKRINNKSSDNRKMRMLSLILTTSTDSNK